MVMSSASSAELALDDDLSLVAYTICLQNQDIYQSKLRELADGKDTVFTQVSKFLLLSGLMTHNVVRSFPWLWMARVCT